MQNGLESVLQKLFSYLVSEGRICFQLYGKFERQITNVSNKAEVGNYQSVLYILENQKIEVISLENEAKNDKFVSKIKNQTYLETYISTHYTLTIGDDKAYFEKNSSPKIVKLHRINNHMLYFKYKKDYYFICILEKSKENYTLKEKEEIIALPQRGELLRICSKSRRC